MIMEILIIGNGFDLAHGLPTKYDDFLDYCEKFKKEYPSRINDHSKELKHLYMMYAYRNNANRNDSNRNDSICSENSGLPLKILGDCSDQLYKHINLNKWLEYFLKRRTVMGKNWIDFETEISKVIQSLDEAINVIKNGKSLRKMSKENYDILFSIYNASNYNASKMSMQAAFRDVKALNAFAALLNKELGRLICALEIYIKYHVSFIHVDRYNKDIYKLNPDRVLSFNYSNTYERIYGKKKKVEYDYIHGKADINKNVNTSNLVLGIDEYLDDDIKDKELELLPFKKFYQRIYKSTGNRYLNWVDEIKDEYADYINPKISSGKGYPSHTLYIFGHSLDVTDKDILKLFICNDNVQTKIFYHRKNEEDKAELGKLIKNLIKIMGQEELIRRTGGTHKTIEFVPQTLEPGDVIYPEPARPSNRLRPSILSEKDLFMIAK